MKRLSRFIWISITTILFLACTSAPPMAGVNSYIDPAYLHSLSFGFYSHWLQPWRAYLETVPTAQFLNGIGINYHVDPPVNLDLIVQMLSQHGIRRGRIEIGWSEVNFDDGSRLNSNHEAIHRDRLRTLQAHNIRPLILLNAHHGIPGPVKTIQHQLLATAEAGARQILLDQTQDLKVGYSGLSNLTDYRAAELLFTEIQGNTVTLSKPLPKRLEAGTTVVISTLKYRPFSPPDTQDYRDTIAGWQRYVDTVARFAADALGTSGSADKGFDLEIWNELSFGSDFLYINRYYDPKPFDYNEDSIWDNLITETVNYVEAHADLFTGVALSNGFSNTVPWVASSKQPQRIRAINKHPYAGRKSYPQDEDKNKPLNALFQEYDKAEFIPTYEVLFPEYYGNALQTETLIRDMAPITTEIYGTPHGRYARVIDGKAAPTEVWITEVNTDLSVNVPGITTERALAVKTKMVARYFCFYLNKGVTQVYLYAALGDERGFGIVSQKFVDHAAQPGAVYPDNDDTYVSSPLRMLDRMVNHMNRQIDSALRQTRQLQVVSIRDVHDHVQFRGKGTEAYPDLFDRDVLTLLPFQSNSRRFVIPYYVMTRNITKDLAPEEFTVKIRGLRGRGASVTAYDPIRDRNIPVRIEQRGPNELTLNLTATDYPYLLEVEEAA